MKTMTGRRIHALLLAVSMVICMFGLDCRAKASETGQQMDEAVKLAVPQNVREEDGFIVWDEVEDAYGYTIQAGKGEETWEYKWYENRIEWNRFIYEHCPMRDFGDYAFKVCAFDETGESTEFSSPVTVSYHATLSMPVNVKVSETDSRQLTWDEVEGAVRYNIRVYKNDESHSLYTSDDRSYNSYWLWEDEEEYLVTVQAMDQDYHVSEWTEEVMVKVVEQPRLATPQNVRFDESGENIIWDDVEGADYYSVYTGFDYNVRCEQPMLENWKRYISPRYSGDHGEQCIYVYAFSQSDGIEGSYSSDDLTFEYTPARDESITVPQIKLEDDHIIWDEAENAFRYECQIKMNGENYDYSGYEKDYTRYFAVGRYPEGDYEIELCVIDEEGKYNSKMYPITLDTAHDERVWVPKLYHKFETILWDYDRLRHPDTSNFWVRIRRQRDGAVVRLERQYNEYYYGLMDLKNGDYTIDACARQYVESNGYKLGNWSESMNIEKHGEGLFEEENETTTEVETPPEATDIPEEDRIKSITINPAFNMKNKDDSDVELDLSKIKIKAKEIYDEEGLKRAEEALGETLNGNKHYNLLDLTLLYDGKDFSNGYDGLVKVIIPLPNGHRDKTFSCYRLTETDGKVTKEIIPGEQTEDSYIIYLEHFSEYALVAAGAEDPHTHVYSTDWESDVTGHWKECSCKDKAEESVHTQDEGTVTKEATKTEPGIKTYKCSVCGYVIKTEEIPKLPAEDPHTHIYSTDWKSDETGHWKECDCKERAEESAHTQDEGTVTKEATKTEPGIKTYKCTVCGYVMKTEEIPKLPAEDPHTHAYSTDWKSDATGHWKECSCKDKAEESAHTQDEGTVTKEATKTEPGIKTYKCSVCGYVIKTEEIPKLPAEEPHTHVYSTDWKSDATGHWKECSCKDKAEESVHTQDAGTVTKEATNTEPGIRTYKCSVCGYVIKTEEIPKLPAEEPHTHVYSTDWKSDATGHWKECDCKDKAEESAHTQDAGTVTKEATKTEPGIKTYKCSVCGYVIKTEEIPKMPADEEPINEKIPVTTKVSKEQKKKNEIIMNKNISFKITGNSLAVAWKKLSGADGYDIYAALCDDDFKGVTVSVGKAKSSATIRKINGSKISGKKTYKVKVKAYILSDGKKQYVGTSAVMHVTGSLNKKTTNAKKINLKKKTYTLKEGKSAQIRATIIKADKKKKLLSKDHGPKLSYVSSDETIATVTATGKIKAKKRGKCTIYVRALNGVSKKIKVTVK